LKRAVRLNIVFKTGMTPDFTPLYSALKRLEADEIQSSFLLHDGKMNPMGSCMGDAELLEDAEYDAALISVLESLSDKNKTYFFEEYSLTVMFKTSCYWVTLEKANPYCTLHSSLRRLKVRGPLYITSDIVYEGDTMKLNLTTIKDRLSWAFLPLDDDKFEEDLKTLLSILGTHVAQYRFSVDDIGYTLLLEHCCEKEDSLHLFNDMYEPDTLRWCTARQRWQDSETGEELPTISWQE